jgi:hypothetical protein
MHAIVTDIQHTADHRLLKMSSQLQERPCSFTGSGTVTSMRLEAQKKPSNCTLPILVKRLAKTFLYQMSLRLMRYP